MTFSTPAFLFFAVIALCFAASCEQAVPRNKFIDEINAAKVRARNLQEQAERKLTQARERAESGDRAAHEELIEEAAQLYGQTSDALNEAVKNANEMTKVKSPEWYKEYFSLHSKLIDNLSQLASGAQVELLVRKNRTPTDAEVQSWRENMNRIRKDNAEYQRQISAIEARQGIKLITE